MRGEEGEIVMSPTKAETKARAKATKVKSKPAAVARSRKPSRPVAVGKRAVASKAKPKTTRRAMSLKERLAVNDKLFKDTGSMFGLTKMKRKQQDPGTYEARMEAGTWEVSVWREDLGSARLSITVKEGVTQSFDAVLKKPEPR